jgi:hypothetical protein
MIMGRELFRRSCYDQRGCGKSCLGLFRWVSLNEEASRVARDASKAPSELYQNNKVTQLLDKAKQNGWNTVRVFAHGQSQGYQLQTAPGVYHHRGNLAYLTMLMAGKRMDLLIACAGIMQGERMALLIASIILL